MHGSHRHSTFIQILLLFCFAEAVHAERYSLQVIQPLPGCDFSRGTDLNNRGQVTGWAETGDDISKAFLWESGSIIELKIEGAAETLASSINSRGTTAGSAIVDGMRRSFVWQNRKATDLGPIDSHPVLGLPGNFIPGCAVNDRGQVVHRNSTSPAGLKTSIWVDGQDTFPIASEAGLMIAGLAINSRNEIAGQLIDGKSSPATSKAFLWRKGELIELGSLGGSRASATGINDTGTVIGWALPPGKSIQQAHAFVWRKGTLEDLGTLGGETSRAYGLNEHGSVVGYAQTANETNTAFLWNPETRTMTNLNSLIDPGSGWHLSVACAINDSGQILAFGSRDGKSRAILLSPAGAGQEDSPAKPSLPEFDAEPRILRASAPSAISFASIEKLPSGDFLLKIKNESGEKGRIQFSTDLVHWAEAGIVENRRGVVELTHSGAGNSPLRFYRIAKGDTSKTTH